IVLATSSQKQRIVRAEGRKIYRRIVAQRVAKRLTTASIPDLRIGCVLLAVSSQSHKMPRLAMTERYENRIAVESNWLVQGLTGRGIDHQRLVNAFVGVARTE